jgi:hypothetical protein
VVLNLATEDSVGKHAFDDYHGEPGDYG